MRFILFKLSTVSFILLFLSCSDNSNDAVSKVTLRVKAGSYQNTNLSLHPDHFSSLQQDNRFMVPTNCVNQSEATRCVVRYHDLARVRCEVYTDDGFYLLSSQSNQDLDGVDAFVTSSKCIKRVLCGPDPIQIPAKQQIYKLDRFSSTVEVSLKDNNTEVCDSSNLEIQCQTLQEDCLEHGFGCKYKLICENITGKNTIPRN